MSTEFVLLYGGDGVGVIANLTKNI